MEWNIKPASRPWKIKVLVYLSRFLHHKPFKEMLKEDVIAYLNSLRKKAHFIDGLKPTITEF